MIRLSELLAATPETLAPRRVDPGAQDPAIGGVGYDSRRARPGELFVALRGELADGHDHLEQALDLGAVALLVEALPEGFDPRAAAVACVRDTRAALAPVAAQFFGWPAGELDLIGVTGTNGKTSSTMLVESILKAAGRRTGLIGTVEIRWPGHHERAVNTTPESLDLQRTLRAMRTDGVDAAVMEVSSHGLALGRVNGCRFRAVGLTNVTQDHLDFHDTMQAYRDAKLRLFREHLTAGAWAVVNVDDEASELFLEAAQKAAARVLRVSRRADAGAEVGVVEEDVRLDGTRARLLLPDGPLDVTLPLVGAFNVENAVVAVGLACALGIPSETIARGLATCPQVPGRVERVGAHLPDSPAVLVDYAHTPDAVEKLLRTLRPLTPGRLLTVFGCGGDRDRSKRPLMAEAVARSSDRAVVTSDNARTEDPEAILRDVERGLGRLRRVDPSELDQSAGSYCSLVDRRVAIALAVQIARPEDTVVIAGKGHEDYQIVGRERFPFDDRVEALRALEERPR